MNDQDLDRSYTALCEALGAVGPRNSALLLALLCLDLLARCDSADEALPLIGRARACCLEDGDDGA